MEKDEFAIDRDKASLVYLNKSRVEGIFQVTLIFLPKPKSTDPPLQNGDNKSWISLEYPADKARHGELAKVRCRTNKPYMEVYFRYTFPR